MGLVSGDQLQIGLLEQKKTGKQLGDALIALGFVTEEAMREALERDVLGLADALLAQKLIGI